MEDNFFKTEVKKVKVSKGNVEKVIDIKGRYFLNIYMKAKDNLVKDNLLNNCGKKTFLKNKKSKVGSK